MPYLDVRTSAPVAGDVPKRIASALTGLTDEILGKKRELTSVSVVHLPPTQWFVDGASMDTRQETTVYLEIKVTEGTNTKNEKSRYVKEAFRAFESILGKLTEASYIVIQEVAADAWGYGGETQEFRYIRGKAL